MMPESVVGHWLLASVIGARVERERLREFLNEGDRQGWSLAEAATVRSACQLALQLRYPGGPSEEDLFGLEQRIAPNLSRGEPSGYVSRVALEALGLTVDDLQTPALAFASQALITALALWDAGLSTEASGDLIVGAETLAASRGFTPPPLPHGVPGVTVTTAETHGQVALARTARRLWRRRNT